MVSVFYSPTYVAAGHSFATTRKAKWIADSLAQSPIKGIELVEPTLLSREQVSATHDLHYVDAVETGVPRSLAESQGFDWDAGLWPMVLASNGGAVAAALAAMRHGVAGSLSSGLHHARRDSGEAFCTFNGLVIAAREALAAGARTVLILDFDAHCGGGTQSLVKFDRRIWQVDVSVSSFDAYDASEQLWLDLVAHATSYLTTVEQRLTEVGERGPHFELCLYNAGMDPCENSAIGGLAGITPDVLAQRERLVFDWCRNRQVPIAFVLAGGYVGERLGQDELVNLHRLTLSTAASPR